MGALSWHVESGHAGNVKLAGLSIVLALRYDDEEPGSPSVRYAEVPFGPFLAFSALVYLFSFDWISTWVYRLMGGA